MCLFMKDVYVDGGNDEILIMVVMVMMGMMMMTIVC